jgi:hypothetical protein
MRTLALLCLPSMLASMALAAWGLLRLWTPSGAAGWAGMALLWLLCAALDVAVHAAVVARLVPDSAQEADAVRRRMDRLRGIADANEAQSKGPLAGPRLRGPGR